MDWHGIPARRWGLRPIGILLLLGAYAAGHRLMDFAGYVGDPSPILYLLAVAAFLCSSAGFALLIHGHHLFDTVALPERWRAVSPSRLPVSMPDGPSVVPIESGIIRREASFAELMPRRRETGPARAARRFA